jgi:predicted MFS family arabinose efflux permease
MRPIALICAGALLSPLDSSVNIAFPSIVEAFAIQPRDIQWVVIAFVVAQSLASLAFGRVGDLYGHRRVFAAGLACCVLAHWAVALSQTFGALVATRALQGAAIGMAVACAPALIAKVSAPGQTARMLALYSAAISAGFMMGPLAGGALVQQFGWQGVFTFRVVLSGVVLALIPFWLRADLEGLRSRHSADPMPRPRVAWAALAARRFLALQGAALVIYMATFSILLWVPFLLASWASLSLSLAGVMLAAFPMGSFAAGMLAAKGPWPPGIRYSGRLVRGGLACASLGLGAVAGCALVENAWAIAGALFICGAGLGSFQAGYTERTMRWLPADNSGIAGSLLTFIRLGGLVVGVPILSALGSSVGIPATLAASAALLAVWALTYRAVEPGSGARSVS